MQELFHGFLGNGLSRRGFVTRLTGLGFTAAAANTLIEPLEASENADAQESAAAGITMEGTGGQLVVAQAKAAGTEYLFCNPGSYEVGFYDAFTEAGNMQLIMGLHEGVVISMADGYHRVSQRPAFVNVHVIAGTAQAAGQIYNAGRDGSALVITAGMNDNELWNDDAGLAPRPGFDQKEVNRQFTKISWEARNGASLALMIRRAFKVADTAPGGPVYLAMAHHALEAKGVSAQILPAERFMIRSRVRPEAAAVEKAARHLIEAKRPVAVVGDEIWKSGAAAEFMAFAERMGLAVTAGTQGFRNFPVKHPQYLGGFNMGSDFIKQADLVVCVGSRDFGDRLVPTSPEVPTGAHIMRIGIDTAAMGRTSPTDLALVGDVKSALDDLNAAIGSLATKDRLAKIAESRVAPVKALVSAAQEKAAAASRANFGKPVIHPDELGAALAATLERDTIFVSENLTGRHDAFSFGHRADDMMWLGNTGNSLGWGLGAAIGAKLAAPNRPVVCSIGDGSVMYSAPAFWTMARYSVPVLTIVWNNHNYQTVRHAYYAYQGKMVSSNHYAGMYLGDPNIDFAKLAESQGVKGERVEHGPEIAAAVKRGMAATREGRPYLVEVNISRWGGGADSEWYEKFSLADKRTRKV